MKTPSSGSPKPGLIKMHKTSEASPALRTHGNICRTSPALLPHGNSSAPQAAGSPNSRFIANSMTVLRRRLTLLYTVTTSLILTLVMAAFLIMRIRETKQGQMEDFYDLWNSLQFRLQSDTTIAQGFLAQTEADRRVVIHIEENGTALLYNGSWQPQTPRDALIARVKALAEADGVFTTVRPISASSVVSSIFTFQGEAGEDYCARVLVSAFGKSVRALCLIAYVPPVTDALRTTLIWLAVLEILGVAGLTAISWYFVGWSLRPVEESRRKQAEFIAAASHELRSPLAVLRSGIAVLRDLTAGSAGQAADLLSTFDSECARMARLIDDMLLLASADAGTWKLQLSEVDMDTLLIDTYDAYLPLCRQKGIDLQLSLPENALPSLRGDAERIRQILAILLDNAMTYTPAGRIIQIRAELSSAADQPGQLSSRRGRLSSHPDCPSLSLRRLSSRPDRPSPSPRRLAPQPGRTNAPGILLHVVDQGPGIPDDVKPYIFDRFYRADPSRSDKSHFGFGLSIAKELAVLHGGSIYVTDAETGGSCFTAVFPLRQNAAD